MFRSLAYLGLAALALQVLNPTLLPAAGETFRRAESYNVLDTGNDSSGGIVSNAATTGLLGRTAGEERPIAVRERDDATTIVYMARGSITTADRSGGVVGIAALRLEPLAPGRNPNAPGVGSNYVDTGLITKAPSNFAYVMALFYDPVTDRVYVVDGNADNAMICSFAGGTTGPNTGIVSAVNAITPTTHFNASATVSGPIRGIAVRTDNHGDVDPANDTVSIALAASNHLEMWQSTSGWNGAYSKQFETTLANTWGGGTLSANLLSVAFDSNGDIWATNGWTSQPRLYLFHLPGNATGTPTPTLVTLVGQLADEPPFLPRVTGVISAANGTHIGCYRDPALGKDVFVIGLRSGATTFNNTLCSTIRVTKLADSGPYTAANFQIADAFGTGSAPQNAARNLGSPMRDSDCATFAPRGSTLANQPASGGNEYTNFAIPLRNSATLEPAGSVLYSNLPGIDSSKGQTVRTSAVHRVLMTEPAPVVYRTVNYPGLVEFADAASSTAGRDARLALNVTSIGMDTGVTVAYHGNAAAPGNTPVRTLKGYWSIGATAAMTTDIRFTYQPEALEAVNGRDTSLRVIKSEDGGATWIPVSSVVDTVAHTVTATGQSSFSVWALQAAEEAPVTMSHFSAE